MLSFLFGMVLSLLPKRYRERLPDSAWTNLRQGAITSGLIASVVCLTIVIVRYLAFLQYRVGTLGERAISRGAETALIPPVVHYGMGYVAMVEYLFHPLTLLLIYFTVEGVARVLAAVVTEEIVGTLPLYGVAWVEERWGQARAERALGPRVPDIVEEVYSPDYDLRIFTCRRKRNWDRMITVAYQDRLYELVGDQSGRPPHHFVYRLRKSRPGRVIRTVHHYDPQEVMQEKQSGAGIISRLSGWSQLKLAAARASHAAQPPLPDIVEPIQSNDYQLRISSCRPKPKWDHLITIEYQDEFYEVVAQERGTSTYPHVYLLRRLPPGKIIRTIRHYTPEEPLNGV